MVAWNYCERRRVYESCLFDVFCIVLAILFYISALNSAPNAISLFFILPFFTPYWWVLIFPLVMFVRGRRWRTSLIKRKWKHKNLNLDTGFKLRHLINIPKVLAFYIYQSIMPVKLAFFYSWGVKRSYFSLLSLITCGILCLEFLNIGMYIDYRMVFWWFFSIGIFTHFAGVKGQYVCERYLLLANVGFCVLMGYLNHNLFLIVSTIYFARSLLYIPCWRSNETLFRNGMISQPDTPENFNNLANYYIDKGQITNAIAPLQVAEHIISNKVYNGRVLLPTNNANLFNIHISLAKCYYAARHYQRAMIYAKKALEKDCPKNQIEKVQHLNNEIHNKIIQVQKNEKELRKRGIIT